MKKAGLLFIVLTILVNAQAQVSLGLRSGYTASDIRVSGTSRGDLGDAEGFMETFHGWHLDLLFNVPLQHGFYFQPVIRYVTKGTGFQAARQPKAELSSVYVPLGSRLKLNYLEIPFNFVYKLPLGSGKIAAGFGPYVAHGLKGRYDFDIVQNGQSVTQNSKAVQFSSKPNDNLVTMRVYPWDAGANFVLGYEFNNGIMISGNYSLGLTDVDRNRYTTSRNTYFGISVGFLFNREDY